MQWSQQSHMSSAWIASAGLWIITALSHGYDNTIVQLEQINVSLGENSVMIQ
jgi:hypothetical protein